MDRQLERAPGRDRPAPRTSRCRIAGPVSTPSSTKWTVTPVVLDPRVQRLADRVEAGEGGQQRGVDVDDAVAEAVDEGPLSSCM